MLPNRGRGSAAAMYSAISTTWVTAPPSVPPDIKNHVGPHRPDPLDLFVREPPVVGGQDIDDDRAGAQRGPLRAFPRHILHYSGHHHLQPAAGAAGGNVDVHADVRLAPVAPGLG